MMSKPVIAECVFTSSQKIIDTHVHYNMSPLFEDWQSHWQKAQERGVVQSVIAGSNLVDSQVAVEIANQAEGLWALVGVHPSEVDSEDVSPTLSRLSELLANKKVLGVGEIGLDYYWLRPEEREQQIPLQKKWFTTQLELAREHDGWVCLHVRDRDLPQEPTPGNAYWDTWEIMSQYDWSKQPFILHCVSGPLTYIAKMLGLGAYLGFDGNITYPKAQELRAILDVTLKERILLETDAPYLPPQPYRGQICEPWMISETAKWVEIHQSSSE
jgi:TatD DNase family protein